MAQNTRYLIVPQVDLDGDALVSVLDGDDVAQEEGLTTKQPTLPATGSTPGGDIRPTLSGSPTLAQESSLRITTPGPLDKGGRFGWARTDSTGTPLQFRQASRVAGRRVDVLAFNDTPGSSPYLVRPRLQPLNSGGLLACWGSSATDVPVAGGRFGAIKMATMSPDGTWSSVSTPITKGFFTQGILGYDLVQYPDTDELVLITSEFNGVDRYFFVHTSEDDAASWTLRSWIRVDGATYGSPITFDVDALTDGSAAQDVALEVLDNGRLVCAAVTLNAVWTFTSDDRGRNWGNQFLLWNDARYGTGSGVAMTKNRSGTVLLCMSRTTASGTSGINGESIDLGSEVAVASTRNGVEWLGPDTTGQGPVSASPVMRPDGRMVLYTCQHEHPGSVYNDWLACSVSTFEDAGDTPTTGNSPAWPEDSLFGLFPGSGSAFHIRECPFSSGHFALGATNYNGFAEVAAANWRGQNVLLAVEQEQLAGGFISSAVLLLKTAHWQPIQENLNYVDDDPAYPAQGMIYNRVWDPTTDTPALNGWLEGGAGFSTDVLYTVEDGETDGGYIRFSTNAGSKFYYDTSLPGTASNLGCAFRFLVRPLNDSGVVYPHGLNLALDDGANRFDISVRLDIDNVTNVVYILVYDNNLGGTLGSTFFPDTEGYWIEVVGCHDSNNLLSVYARPYYPETDPDWDRGYTDVVKDATLTLGTSGAGDYLGFGVIIVDSAESDWKSVQFHRSVAAPGALQIGDLTYQDEPDDKWAEATPYNNVGIDDGLYNVMRTSRITANPAQYLSRGVSASWRGEAVLTGNYDYETGYDYAGRNMLEGPTLKEWRSLESTSGVVEDIEVLLDAGEDLQFKPTALAVFGRNFTSMRVQMNDSKSWGSSPVDMTLGTPSDLLTCDRYTHIWSTNSTNFTTAVSNRQILCYRGSGTFQGPWRAHQFKSQETGPKYYVMLKDSTGTDAEKRKVYRILDNDEGMLTLAGNPGDDGFTTGVHFDIFSDRFAVFLGRRHSVLNPTYRYIKITFYGCNHRDTDENFHRLGRLMLGYAHDLSNPMFDWGWSYAQESGNEITEGTNGVRYSQRRSSPRRSFDCTYRLLRGNEEASAVLESPESSYAYPDLPWYTGGGGHPKTWGHIVDLLRGIGLDGERVALVWDGDRAEDVGSGSSVVQTATEELLMVRVASVGEMQHVGYEGRTKNLADGDECRPTPMMTQSVTFEEEF